MKGGENMENEKLQANCKDCGVHNEVSLRFDDSVLTVVMNECHHEFPIGKLKLENGSDAMHVKVSVEPLLD